MHIVSTVEGRLREGENAFSLLRAAFPAGTLTGAPKIRAMEIITEIEDLKRGPYGGAVGYFSFTGNMDTCITIRTIVMIGDTAYLQAHSEHGVPCIVALLGFMFEAGCNLMASRGQVGLTPPNPDLGQYKMELLLHLSPKKDGIFDKKDWKGFVTVKI